MNTPIVLNDSSSFAILAYSTVTNTGPTVINGNLGLYPDGLTSITGFPPGTVHGTTYAADSVAGNAQIDASNVFTQIQNEPIQTTLTGGDLGGLTLSPGVYKAPSSIGLTGTLTLNGGGDSNSQFLFNIGSTFTSASASKIVLENGAQACNVFFAVGSSATFGTSSVLFGTFIALASITANTGTGVDGRLFALTGAVSLDTNLVTVPNCLTPGTVTATKSAPFTFYPGQSFSYTLITNSNSTISQNVSISDNLIGVTVNYISPSIGSVSAGVFTATVQVSQGNPSIITINVTPKAGYSVLHNSYTATPTGGTAVSSNTTTSNISNSPPNITLTKTASSSFVSIGQIFTYTLQINNNTGSSITGAIINDILPSNLSFISATGSLVNTVTSAFNVIKIILNPIPIGNSIIYLTVKAIASGTTKNSFSLRISNIIKIFSQIPSSVTVLSPLILTKSVSTTCASICQNIAYTLSVTNPNNTPLTNVILTDILPNTLTYSQQTGSSIYNPCSGILGPFTLQGNSTNNFVINTVANKAGSAINSFTLTTDILPGQIFNSNTTETCINNCC
ncbi:MAG: ice-binding family protein [Acidimicrobiales bacterium]